MSSTRWMSLMQSVCFLCGVAILAAVSASAQSSPSPNPFSSSLFASGESRSDAFQFLTGDGFGGAPALSANPAAGGAGGRRSRRGGVRRGAAAGAIAALHARRARRGGVRAGRLARAVVRSIRRGRQIAKGLSVPRPTECQRLRRRFRSRRDPGRRLGPERAAPRQRGAANSMARGPRSQTGSAELGEAKMEIGACRRNYHRNYVISNYSPQLRLSGSHSNAAYNYPRNDVL